MGRRERTFHWAIQIHHDGHFAIIRRHRLQDIEQDDVPHPEALREYQQGVERGKGFQRQQHRTEDRNVMKSDVVIWLRELE